MINFGVIEFQNNFWFWVSIAIIFLFVYFIYINKKKKDAAINFSELEIAKSIFGKGVKSFRNKYLFTTTFIAIFLIALGLADPVVISGEMNSELSIVFSIDASFTMDNLEGNTTRFEMAKELSQSLIKSLDSNDLVGIVDFGSSQFARTCLTTNHDQLIFQLNKVMEKPRKEFALIGDGLIAAANLVESQPNKNKRIVLLSDGTNAETNVEEDEQDELIRYLLDRKIKVFSVGIGSDLIAVYDGYPNGRAKPPKYIMLNKQFLEKVGKKTGGDYFKYQGIDMTEKIKNAIYQDIERDNRKNNIGDFFFAFALFLLLINVFFRFGPYRVLQ